MMINTTTSSFVHHILLYNNASSYFSNHPKNSNSINLSIQTPFRPLKLLKQRRDLKVQFLAESKDSIDLLDSMKQTFASATSLAATAMVVRSVINNYLPSQLRDYVSKYMVDLLFSRHTIVIRENEGHYTNRIFEAAKVYLATKIVSNLSMKRIRVSKLIDEQKTITFSPEEDQEMVDVFQGVEVRWMYRTEQTKRWSFELTFHHRHKDMVIGSYLPYILDRARDIMMQDRALRLHTHDEGYDWSDMQLNHPATFDTLAMDLKVKQKVMDDLARFVKRKDYYKRIGKAWKRGYLLYGPPGTGKSSLIAAMTNYLKFDIYNLELAAVGSNCMLQSLLVGMENKSILLVEDIDCATDFKNRESNKRKKNDDDDKLTLSGLLNTMDGLWSCCTEERIIVFTTNYKDRLDPALVRPGRMDVHIYMGYCCMDAFKTLAFNYHGVEDHPLFKEIEELIKKVEVTPAEVAEQLIRSDEIETAFTGFVEFLKEKKIGENAVKLMLQEKETGENSEGILPAVKCSKVDFTNLRQAVKDYGPWPSDQDLNSSSLDQDVRDGNVEAMTLFSVDCE